ncbi:MAG TPA: replicative DNA helicase, partial [Phycisphaerales bacterium]|nr:replicative DNA helicase [Phycisphaerales bacterium]
DGSVFADARLGLVYDAMAEIDRRGEKIDVVPLVEALDGVTADTLIGYAESVPSARHAETYARAVARASKRRRLIESAGKTMRAAIEADGGDDEVDAVLADAERQLLDIAEGRPDEGAVTLDALITADAERLATGEITTGILTGFADLDALLGGLTPGEFHILAARPSMGKTGLALNMAEQIAAGGCDPWGRPESDPVPVAFFSLEMGRESLMHRMVAARSGVDATTIARGGLSLDDAERVLTAHTALRPLPIHIDDGSGLTAAQIAGRTRRLVERHGVRVVFIDYLQLIASPSGKRENRQVEVSDISRQIKAMARRHNIAVVCLAQLNRALENRADPTPRMSDLRESGSLEQDADVVMLLHREAYYHKNDEQWIADHEGTINDADLIVAKHRNGPTGTVGLVWDERIVRFKTRTYTGGVEGSDPILDTA